MRERAVEDPIDLHLPATRCKAVTTRPGAVRTAALTALTLIAFAANSVLCRLALGDGAIDAASFTTVRLVSGALTLLAISAARRRTAAPSGSWVSAAILFLYAVPFSFAYLSLSARLPGAVTSGNLEPRR